MAKASNIGHSLQDSIHFSIIGRILDRDLVDEILLETGRQEKRVRALPGRVTVYYVVALGLFFGLAYEEVLERLIGGMRRARSWAPSWSLPTSSSLSKARQRLGSEPLKQLFERVSRPLATISTPGAFYRGLRVMAVDGLIVEMPDSPANNEKFSHTRTGVAPGAFPVARILALAECGTHAVVGAIISNTDTGESSLINDLMPDIEPGMLVLADRGLAGRTFFEQIRDTNAHALLRVSKAHRLDVLDEYDDGSYLSVLLPNKTQVGIRQKVNRLGGPQTPRGRDHLLQHGTACRVISYTVDHPSSDGETIRLITSILDPDHGPALELAALYQERWEIELSFDEVQNDVTGATKVLRSRSPELVIQEIYGILLAHYTTRALIHEASQRTGIDPDRFSLLAAIRIVRRHAIGQADFSPSRASGDIPGRS